MVEDGRLKVGGAEIVKTDVDASNGPIAIGDPLTASAVPGFATKAVEPGFIVTELMRHTGMQTEFEGRLKGAPPSVPAAVIAWLATDPEAGAWNGRTVPAQKLAAERQLAPGWPA